MVKWNDNLPVCKSTFCQFAKSTFCPVLGKHNAVIDEKNRVSSFALSDNV